MAGNGQLVALLERSLEVTCLNAGSNVSNIRTRALTTPYTVMGCAADLGFTIISSVEPSSRVFVAAGEGYILPEGHTYEVLPERDGRGLYHWSHHRLQLLGELSLFHFLRSPLRIPAQAAGRVARANQALERSFSANGDEPVIQCVVRRRLLSSDLLRVVLEHCEPIPNAVATLEKVTRLLQVLRFMRDQMARPIFRAELARVAGLSASRFHALFLEATGQSPLEYLTRVRLKRAQELLLSTGMQVQEVAQQVGFRDPFHFTRTFKRVTGNSPRGYRDESRRMMRFSEPAPEQQRP